jgi:hypothetical protein
MNRKTLRGLLATAAVSMLSAATLLADGPTPVHNAAFDITLPVGFSAFTEQSQSVKGTDGMIETKNWIAKSPTGEAVVVTVSRMPGKILDAEKMFASTRDSLIKSLNATLEDEQKTADGSVVLTFRSQSAAFLRSRLDVRDESLYQVLYVGRSEEQRANPATAQLFESYRIAAPASAEPVPATPAAE